jgi:hypothetical protein
MSGPPLRKLLSFWASQAAGLFVSGLALAPGTGPGSASSSLRGALPWRPDHPTVARGSSQQANWRWFRPPRLAHRAQTPGRPVRAKLDHATCRVRPNSARFDACRAAPLYAPTSLDMDHPLWVAPCSCSKLALNSRSVSSGVTNASRYRNRPAEYIRLNSRGRRAACFARLSVPGRSPGHPIALGPQQCPTPRNLSRDQRGHSTPGPRHRHQGNDPRNLSRDQRGHSTGSTSAATRSFFH